MKNKKIAFFVMLALMMSAIFIEAAFDSNEDQGPTPAKVLKRIRRSGFTLREGHQLWSFSTDWEKVAEVQVNAKNAGYVYVTASGDIWLPDDAQVNMAVSEQSDALSHHAQSISNYGSDGNQLPYSCSGVFYVPAKGTYTYYLIAFKEYYEGTGSILIFCGVLAATWIDERNVTYFDSTAIQ